MSGGPPVGLAVLGALGGLKAFHSGFKDLKLERLLGGTAFSKVRSLALGSVELSGVARPGPDPVRDPIYENPCVYYHVTLREQRGSGKNERWVTLYDNESALPFFLEDDTGRILVYPGGAELYLEKTVDVRVGAFFGDAPDNRLLRFISLFPGMGGTRHLVAYIMTEKQELCVYGFAGPDFPKPQTGPTFEEEIRKLKADPERMTALDKNGDGEVDGEEWDAGVAQLRAQWEAARPPVEAPPIVIRKPQDGPLVVSDDSRGKFVEKLEWRSALKVFGGPALTLACAAYLAFSFGWFR